MLADKCVTFEQIAHDPNKTISEQIVVFSKNLNAFAVATGFCGRKQLNKTQEFGSTTEQLISNPLFNIIVSR